MTIPSLTTLDHLARKNGYYTWLETQSIPDANPPRGQVTAIGLVSVGETLPAYLAAFTGGLKGEDFEDAIDDCCDWMIDRA